MARSGRDDLDTTDDNLSAVVRWGVTLILVAVHCLIAIASGSLAVMAELLHNFVDLASAGVLVAGLKLAARKSAAFPYGLYKIENLVAAGLAMMIFFTAYEIVSLVFLERGETPDVDVWMLASLGVTTLVPLAFSHFELRVAHRTNSPALLADAREYRVHVYTTGLALAALLTACFALPFDQVAALIIAAAVVKTGWICWPMPFVCCSTHLLTQQARQHQKDHRVRSGHIRCQLDNWP